MNLKKDDNLFRGFLRFKLYYLIAAAAVGIVGIALETYERHKDHVIREAVETPVGEERTMHLADGSSIHLRGGTRVEAFTSAGLTEVNLLEGRILVDVADSSHRVFRVNVPNARIRDIGTQFAVSTQGRQSSVTVLEGSVEITSLKRHTDALVSVTQGQRAYIDREGKFFLVQPDGHPGTAAPQVFRNFHGTPLGEVAEDFDGNNAELRFVIKGEARQIRVDGTFNLARPQNLIAYLQQKEAGVDLQVNGKIVTVSERKR